MSHDQAAVVLVADHESPAATDLVLNELEGVPATVDDIDQLAVGREAPGPLDPQQRFTRLPFASLDASLVLRDDRTSVEDLVRQADYMPVLGIHSQTVVGDIATSKPIANLPQFRQRFLFRIVKVRRVMQKQNITVMFRNLLQRHLPMGSKHGFVRDLLPLAQAVERKQIRGIAHLVRQAASRMPDHLIRHLDQTSGTTRISQLGRTKIHVTKTPLETNFRLHSRNRLSVTRESPAISNRNTHRARALHIRL